MSKHDLLSVEETTVARREGWQMYYVFDGSARSWSTKALPIGFCKSLPHVPAFINSLAERAKSGSPLALKALRMSAQPPFKKEEK